MANSAPRDSTGAMAGQRIKALRKGLGISAQELADRTATLGHPMWRSVITNLETNRRPSLSVDEVIVLSRALGVTPRAIEPRICDHATGEELHTAALMAIIAQLQSLVHESSESVVCAWCGNDDPHSWCPERESAQSTVQDHTDGSE